MDSASQISAPSDSELIAKLRELRKRRRLKHWPVAAVLALGLVLIVLRLCLPSFSGSVVEGILEVAITFGLIPAVLLGFISVAHLRCPRCHDFFHCGKNPRYSEFTQACRHCGLRLDGGNAVMGSNISLERTRGR
jgi:hypothetical protein